MIETGSDLLHHLASFGIAEKYLRWKLRRKRKQNLNFRISGVLVSSNLTNKDIGKCLNRGDNLIITSNYNPLKMEYFPLVEIYETSFKHDLYILEWDVTWLYSTLIGTRLVEKIFQADKGLASTNKEIRLITLNYGRSTTARAILHRIDQKLFMDAKEWPDIKFNKVIIVDQLNLSSIRSFLDTHHSGHTLIVLTRLIPEIIDLLDQMDFHVIWIHPVNLLNEITRELYYLIKKGINLSVEYTIKPVINRYSKNNGLDGI